MKFLYNKLGYAHQMETRHPEKSRPRIIAGRGGEGSPESARYTFSSSRAKGFLSAFGGFGMTRKISIPVRLNIVL
ncbi:hypothetical protein A2Y83_01325 [Candidatus Falkowbacteria bacterium RBG_13_39_14]|uniref:Uncharacterized protein n=1 Tax=Candidatus Falkowbacteria bacterium RBG_13_39_14 TaxID=1797985 RepID=A0A1F5S9E6_9BACT|nr:MAG: hypothetical protein A2Y83_01325 [Candidatus Falkowbacteria bacterium RBG_13_39_14]